MVTRSEYRKRLRPRLVPVNHSRSAPPDPSLPVVRPPVRSGFARAEDGVELHWCASGVGPVIVCCNGVGVSTFFWKYLAASFSRRYTVLLWDYRGHGLSDRRLDPERCDLSIVRHADDLAAVLRGAGLDTPALVVGHSMGCQVALEFRRRYPAQVAGLITMLGTAGHGLRTFFDNPRSPTVIRTLHRLARRAGVGANEAVRPWLYSPVAWQAALKLQLVDPYYTRREDLQPYLDHLATMDQRIFLKAVLSLEEHDAWDLLPVLDRPLLVVAAEKDRFTPLWCSSKMVRETPGAELMVLADGSHAALIEQPETINHRIERFIRERLPDWAEGR